MKNRIKIALFLNTTSFGGVEKHVVEIARMIDSVKYEPYIVCPEELSGHFKSMLPNFHENILTIPILDITQPKTLFTFGAMLRRLQPDILHCHLYNATRYGAPIAKVIGHSVVIETGHLVERWRTGYKKFVSNLLDAFLSLFVDKAITVSSAVQEYFLKHKKYSAQKVLMLHNWCDLDYFSPEKYDSVTRLAYRKRESIPPDATVIGIIGRLEEQKGHRYLFDILPKLIGANKNTHVLVVGEGSLQQELYSMATQENVFPNIHFLGFRSDIAELLAIMDILVLPSLFEGMPLTLIEASAMGVPMIASKVDGSSDVVIEGITGFLVEAKNSDELYARLQTLITNPHLRRSMSENATQYARNTFDMKKQIALLEDVYNSVVK
jgi:glycosyltransferase involved in cell wall biosynthesis